MAIDYRIYLIKNRYFTWFNKETSDLRVLAVDL